MWSRFSILGTGGTPVWGAFGKNLKSCTDQLCSAREESSTLLRSLQKRGQQPWAEQQAAGGCPVPCKVDTAGLGRGSKGWVSFTGEAKSIMQQLLGSDRRKGWVDINGEPNWQLINGWRPSYSGRKPSEGRRCTHRYLLQLNKQPGSPQHSEAYPSSTSNRNDNLDLNSEPQMPPSLMGYLHITESQRFLRYSLEAGGMGPRRSSGAPHCPPTRAGAVGAAKGDGMGTPGHPPKAARALASSLDPKASYTGATSRR